MEDERCCGSGTCIINAEGRCWCGQQWDGVSMTNPKSSEEGSAGSEVPRPAQLKKGTEQ